MSTNRRIPRWGKILLGILTGFIVLFYAGGGFVFANMIHADALSPQPPTPDNGVYITAVDANSITLTSTGQRDDTVHEGTFGLSWEGGYGRIGAITKQDGLTISRHFEVVSGAPPRPCTSDLEDCTEVDIEGWAFQNDPSDVGLDYRNVEYASELGPMQAWQIDSGIGDVWAIHVHGWRAARREAVRTLPTFSDSGVTSLVIDYRNDPNAPADPTGLYRFGRSEWRDLEAAVEYAAGQGAEEIILVAYSTGASVQMAFLENSAHSDLVTAVVFDSPNIDMGGTVRYAARERTLPGTSIPVPDSLVAAAMAVADLRWDVGWGEIDYLDRASELLVVPVLVFHGTDDARVSIEDSRRLASEVPHVQLVEVVGAGHVTSWNVDPDAYQQKLGLFLAEQWSGAQEPLKEQGES